MSDSVAKNEAFRLYRDEKWPKELLYKEKYEKIRQELKEAFDGIEFIEDTHRYFYKGQELVATSNVCHLFRNYFDSDAQAERCSNKYWDDESSKYYHMTKQEILDAWEANSVRATTHGTKVHLFGQNVGNWLLFKEELFEGDFEVHVDEDGREYVETTEPKEIAILKYFKALPLSIIPIQFEIQMFSLKYGISGTADLLFLHDPDVEKDDNYDVIKNRLYLMDYKTNADLYKAFDKMLEPFQEMDDNDLGGYLLQAAIYSKFIEDHGFKFVARCLIWLLENGEFEKVPLQRLTDVLFNYLDNHPLKELMEERRHG